MSHSTSMRRKRGAWLRPRFSLWAMLVVITVAAIPLGYVAQRRSWNLRRLAAWEIVEKKRLNAYDPTVHQASLDEATLLNWFRRNVLLEGSTPLLTIVRDIQIGGNVASLGINFLEHDNYKLTDQDLEKLVCFPEIREVSICNGEFISDEGLKVLQNLPNLSELSIDKAPRVKGEFLAKLTHSKRLHRLSLSAMSLLEGEHLAAIGLLGGLKDLRLSDCAALNDAALCEVSLPSSIEALSLTELSIGDKSIARWLKRTRLRTLEIDANISEVSVRELVEHLGLESLRIRNAPLTDECLTVLASLPKLKTLGLVGMPIKSVFLKDFPNTAQLQSISLASTLLSDENARELTRLPKLTAIDLGWTPIDGSSLEHFHKLGVQQLWLTGTQLGEPGKAALAELAGLQFLQLPANWQTADFQRYQKYDPPVTLQVSPTQYDRAGELATTLRLWTGFGALQMDSLDRIPAELMAPVIRLQELAKADKE